MSIYDQVLTEDHLVTLQENLSNEIISEPIKTQRDFILQNETEIRQYLSSLIEQNMHENTFLIHLLQILDIFNETVQTCIIHFSDQVEKDQIELNETMMAQDHFFELARSSQGEYDLFEAQRMLQSGYDMGQVQNGLFEEQTGFQSDYEFSEGYSGLDNRLYQFQDSKESSETEDSFLVDFSGVDQSLIVDDSDMEVVDIGSDSEDVVAEIEIGEDTYVFRDDFIHENFDEIECPICFDVVASGDGYLIEPCAHGYCKDCLDGYFTNKVLSNEVLNIPCPEPNCDSVCGYNDIRVLCTEEIFAKYQDFALYAALNQDENVKWCTNPEGCGNAVIAEPGEMKVVCGACDYEFCFECGEDYHTGTCEEYEQWKIDNGKADSEFKAWERQYCKPCPNCKIRIQKNDGCNHITCVHCGHQWCWLCNGKYTSNHYDIYNVLGCPGLQFKGGNSNKGLGKSIGMKVLVGTGMVVGGTIALPFALIGGTIFGAVKLGKHIKKKSRR